MTLLIVLAVACFVGSISIRMTDPVVPAIALDLASTEAQVSLLASAFAIPYALVQPILGPVGDALGKTRIIKLCLLMLAASTLIAALANSIEMLLVARILAGLAGGGIIPLALATIGDHVPYTRRQVALSHIMTAMIAGTLLGTIGTGLTADLIGWRGALFFVAGLAAAACALAVLLLSTYDQPADLARLSIGRFASAYRLVLANPRAKLCYAAVFCEGMLIFGLMPYVASLIKAREAGGSFEAGLVLAGMGLGGLFYTLFATRLLGLTRGFQNLIRLGGWLAAAGYLGIALQSSWPVEMFAFALLGFGFYSIHNSLQTQATELAPENRGAAVALHAFFFFLGQSVGPIFYGAALSMVAPQILIAVIGLTSLLLALLLAAAFSR